MKGLVKNSKVNKKREKGSEHGNAPAIQQTIKVEKMTPNGSPSKSSPISSFASAVIAGVHMKTKMYIDPSNKEEIIPQDKISGLRTVVEKAAFNAPVPEVLPSLPPSLSSSALLFSP